MRPSNTLRALFAAAMLTTLVAGIALTTAEPAVAINCSFYSRPGCSFSHIEDVSPPEAPDSTYCCVFVGPNCHPGGTRTGPCWLTLPPDEPDPS